MRKHLRTLLCLLLLSCLLCVSVYAAKETGTELVMTCTGILQTGGFPEPSSPIATQSLLLQPQSSPENWKAAKEALRAGMMELAETVDLQQYEIPAEDAKKLYTEVVNDNPELFYASAYFTQGRGKYVPYINPKYSVNGEVDKIRVLYEWEKEILRQQRKALEQKVEEIVDQVDTRWTDLEKALYLHDYIISRGRYDTEKTKDDELRRDAYNMLVNGIGVCQGYTMAYNLLLKKVGIPAGWVSSSELKHIWSLVQIDEKWYHTDLTWDDPLTDGSDRIGRVCHTYFCISGTKMQAGGHAADDWVSSVDDPAADTTFDAQYWESIESAIVPIDRKWYYLENELVENPQLQIVIDQKNKLMETSELTNAGHVVKVIDGFWPELGSDLEYFGFFSGLSDYSGKLVYNTYEAVYSYEIATGETEKLYTLRDDEKQKSGYIYGTTVTENVLQYSLNAEPNVAGTRKKCRLDSYIYVRGGYAYYLENGHTLFLRRSAAETSGHVIAAWYDAEGRMLGVRFLTGRELTVDLSGAAAAKIFSTDQSFAPRTFPLLQQAG